MSIAPSEPTRLTPVHRIVISGYYGYANPGDEAILSVLVGELRQLYPEAALQVISGTPVETAATHGVEAILWSDPSAIAAAVRGADLVVTGGGGIFHDYGGFPADNLFTEGNWGLGFHVTAGVLAAFYGKPHAIWGVGVGPLQSDEGRRYARAICETAAAISVRDAASRDLLVETGVATDRILVAADPAFLFAPAASERASEILTLEQVPQVELRIGIAIRHWAHGVEPERWEGAVAGGLEQILAANPEAQVVFLPFQRFPGEQEDDLAVAQRVSALVGEAVRSRVHVLTGLYTPAEKAALLETCRIVVGMRLHALIFSLRARVPFVALTYDGKVRQVVERCGRGQFGIDPADLTAALLAERLTAALEAGPVDPAPLLEAAVANRRVLVEAVDRSPAAARRVLEGEPLEMVRSGVMALLAAQKQLWHWVRDQKVNYEYQIGVEQRKVEAAERSLEETGRSLDQERQRSAELNAAVVGLRADVETLRPALEAATERAELAEALVEESGTQLASERERSQAAAADWEAYADEMQARLSEYRAQRAWRGMLAIRKAYVLLTRQGWSGRLRFFPWVLSLLAGGGNLETEQLVFPSRPRPSRSSKPSGQ